MFESLLKMFGSANDRALKKLRPIVTAVNGMEGRIKPLSDAELKAKTAEFRQKLDNGAKLDDIMVEAFAVTREAAWRVLGMRHYDVQVIGGAALHQGQIAEMKTGEGKTLVATMPTYLNGLTGKGVHVITVNDYLARRDAEWMGQLYRWLGLSTGVIVNQMDEGVRKAAYDADITYGQNNEFGFDYLRDNMKFDLSRYVQRAHYFALIDEVDSILIDEARTPLIISGPAEDAGEHYITVDKVIPKLKRDIHYNVDEKSHSATLTEEGVEEVEGLLDVGNLYEPGNIVLLHHVNNALKAHTLYRRDDNYLVQGGEVLIIDEHTGRLMKGRRWSDGLHQAVEAKEGVSIQAENQTLATVSFQNYFRIYDKLAGMTGTAKTEETEFQKTYKLDTLVVPTNKPIIRDDRPDLVYATEKGKFRACVAEIKDCNERGQPVLVGTTSVEKSEIIHKMLLKEGIDHEVLNAKLHAREASIVSQAGRLGRVTVATNMAGRGTDIILGGNAEFWGQAKLLELGVAERYTVQWEKCEDFVKQIVIGNEDKAREMIADEPVLAKVPESLIGEIAATRDVFNAENKKVLAAGGLFILGTERHESRRIDNQLRGRAGRQGDPGASRFYLSLEDNLMRIFANDRMQGIMQRLGMSDDQPIEAGMVSKAIENAQRRVEAQHFDVRKNLLEYDDVMDQQRKTVYKWRRRILSSEDDRTMALLTALTKSPQTARGLIDDLGLDASFVMVCTDKLRQSEYITVEIDEEQLTVSEDGKSAEAPPEAITFKITELGTERLAKAEPLQEISLDCIEDLVFNITQVYCPDALSPDKWDLDAMNEAVLFQFNHRVDISDLPRAAVRYQQRIYFEVEKPFLAKSAEFEAGRPLLFQQIAKDLYLRQIDEQWKNHLTVMSQLRTGIGLRSYGQRDPKKEYQKEGFRLFKDLLINIKSQVMGQLFRLQLQSEGEVQAEQDERRRQMEARARQMQARAAENDKADPDESPGQNKGPSPEQVLADRPVRRAVGTVRRDRPKLGRNDPCWCGSGKKYKKCHMDADTVS
ncbi:MAG: preprotein translocase subunit SecA [Bradymonadia bacterium]